MFLKPCPVLCATEAQEICIKLNLLLQICLSLHCPSQGLRPRRLT